MTTIRKMQSRDESALLPMMRVFYDSPAVLHKVSDDVLKRNIQDASGECPYVKGYVFTEPDGKIIGYSIVSLGYSTEYGGVCLWIEDIYLSPECRGRGVGSQFFAFLEEEYRGKAVRLRLEAEPSNTGAIRMYQRHGFETIPYHEMAKEL